MSKNSFPSGLYQPKKSVSPRNVAKWIDEIKELPDKQLHTRWVVLLKSLNGKQLIHPEWEPVVLKNKIGYYAWHENHHLAQIINLKEKKDWN